MAEKWIKMFDDKNFNGTKKTLNLDKYREGKIHSTRSDKMSSVKWDLPDDVVFTFYENSDGTGREYTRGPKKGEDSDTHNNNFKDCASSFRWDHVDLELGFFKAFENTKLGGDVVKRYLSLYKEGKTYSLKDTPIHDTVSSLKWNLPNDVVITLFENSDGKGRELTKGPGTGQTNDTKDQDFKDCASSWRWKRVDLSKGYFKAYEDDTFKGSRIRRYLSAYDERVYVSLKDTGVHDKISSLKWDLPSSVQLVLYENTDGTGRKFTCGPGRGQDGNTSNNNFKDCASSWRWKQTRDVRFDETCFLTAHNAFANFDDGWEYAQQSHSLTTQLKGGVRGFMLDIWRYEQGGTEDVYLCHGECGGSANTGAHLYSSPKTLRSALGEIVGYLKADADAIVTLIFESQVGSNSQDLVQAAFDGSGASSYVFRADKENVATNGWPTLNAMVAEGKRLVVLSSKPQNDGLPGVWNYAVESVYGDDSMDKNTVAARSESAPLNDTSKALFILNYFPTWSLSSLWTASRVLNTYYCMNQSSTIDAQVARYTAAATRLPNFLAVDFYEIGNQGGPIQSSLNISYQWNGEEPDPAPGAPCKDKL